MIPVRLEWERPTDGIEIAFDEELADKQEDSDGLYFLARSDRRIPITFELSDLENPVILHFINCRDNKARQKFTERFGFLKSLKKFEAPVWIERYSNSVKLFKLIQQWIEPEHIFDGRHEKIGTWEDSIEELMGSASLRPTFAIDESGRPQMTLLADSLLSFMVMEAGLVYEVGAEIASCEHCFRLFLTGPMTGRRSTAKYCSDRCRVAAMRVRNAAKED